MVADNHRSDQDSLGGLLVEMEPETNIVISMSTMFYPLEDHPGDLILITEDAVFFSVHKHVLLSNSRNFFGGRLLHDAAECLTVPESAEILNLVLHAFYDFDPTLYEPTLEGIAGMLNALLRYGLPVAIPLALGKPVCDIMLWTAILSPLEVYILASQHQIEHLAIAASQHLLSMPLYNLTEEHCVRMGPVYLRRLMFLHLGRTERLKKMLKDPPTSHTPTTQCNVIDQNRSLRVWKRGVEELYWEVNACTPVSLVQSVLSPIVDRLTCEECKTSAKERIRKLIVDWTLVKTTI